MEQSNGHKANGEQIIQGVRFYHVFLIGLEQHLVTSLEAAQGPMLFRFQIESMLEPGEPEWDIEGREILGTLDRLRVVVAQERDAPSRIITELIHGLRLSYPERSIRVDSTLFACESDPEIVMWDGVEEAEPENGR